MDSIENTVVQENGTHENSIDSEDPIQPRTFTSNSIKSRNVDFQCLICDKVFKYYNSFYSHFVTKHNGEKKLTGRHETRKYYRKLLPLSPPNAPHGLKQKIHKDLPRDSLDNALLYTCVICKYVTIYPSRFQAHCTSKHIWNKRGRELHMQALDSGIPIKSVEAFKQLQAFVRNTLYVYKKQAKRLLNLYHVHKPSTFPLNSNLEALKSNLFCVICFKKLSNKYDLKLHYRQLHFTSCPKKDSSGMFDCRICKFQSNTQKGIATHYAKRHSIGAYYSWDHLDIQKKFKDILKSKRFLTNNEVSTVDEPDASITVVENEAAVESLVENEPVLSENFIGVCPLEILDWKASSDSKHIFKEPIPCQICNFQTTNVIDLLSHCKEDHGGQYPLGFKKYLAIEFNKLSVTKKYDKKLDHLFSQSTGAWVDKEGNLLTSVEFCCTDCNLRFVSMHAVYQHYTNNHEKVFSMDSFKVEAASNMAKENIPIQDITAPTQQSTHLLACEHCEFKCNKKSEMQNHYSENHKEKTYSLAKVQVYHMSQIILYKCLYCPFEAVMNEMKDHLDKEHSNVKLSKDIKSLPSHFNNDSLAMKPISCIDCNFHTVFKKSLLEHYEIEHKHQAVTFTVDDFNAHTCLVCKSNVPVYEVTTHHTQHCTEQASSSHTNAQLNFFACTFCYQAFKNRGNLWRHITFFHKAVTDIITAEGFAHRNDKPEAIAPLPPVAVPELRNVELGMGEIDLKRGMTNSVVSRFSKHILELYNHSKFVGYLCNLCDSLMKNKDHALAHLQDFKTNEKPHTPDSCDLSLFVCCKFCCFISCHVHNFIRHLTRHSKLSLFDCCKCDELFPTVNACLEHMLYQHGVKANTQIIFNTLTSAMMYSSRGAYRCAWCTYSNVIFKNKTEYSAHFFNVHIEKSDSLNELNSGTRTSRFSGNCTNKVRKFALERTCSYDKSNFNNTQIWSREIHTILEHFVQKPMPCSLCSKAFICSVEFINHLILNHQIKISYCQQQYMKLPTDKVVAEKVVDELTKMKPPEEVPSDTSRWECSENCKQKFDKISDIQQHVQDVHKNETLFICFNCDFACGRKMEMESHCVANHKMNLKPSSPVDLDKVEFRTFSEPQETIQTNAIKRPVTREPLISTAPKHPSPSDTMIARKTITKASKASPMERWVTINGISKCLSCDFSCAERSRIQSHVLTNHRSKSRYFCQFCDYSSSNFDNVDGHLEAFHKIQKNSHMAIKIDYDVCNVNSKPINLQDMIEARKNFVYTPVPSIPVLQIEPLLTNGPKEKNNVPSINGSTPSVDSEEGGQSRDSDMSSENGKSMFECMYCGKMEKTTYSLERHLQRHESDYPTTSGFDDIGYAMAKCGIVRKMTY